VFTNRSNTQTWKLTTPVSPKLWFTKAMGLFEIFGGVAGKAVSDEKGTRSEEILFRSSYILIFFYEFRETSGLG
jgi:hypothetical protein